jgi:transcriptional regulator with XRE-family HTH domain
MTGAELRTLRRQMELSGELVCHRARFSRSRLSDIERGLVRPRPDEVLRLSQAIEELAAAKTRIRQVAAEVGWPSGAV